jgi:hypothetical protein
VRDSSPLSRKQISQLSKLSIATTKMLSEELLADHIIIEVGQTNNTRERKASLLQLNEDYCCSIGVNIIPDALEIAALFFTEPFYLKRKFEVRNRHVRPFNSCWIMSSESSWTR